MNTEVTNPFAVSETAAAIIVAESSHNGMRDLDLEEVLLVAGGPETDPTSGSI